MVQLPCEFQINDQVWLTFWSHSIGAEIHAIHFTKGKVMYDLNVIAKDGLQTRIYRVDPAIISKTKK